MPLRRVKRRVVRKKPLLLPPMLLPPTPTEAALLLPPTPTEAALSTTRSQQVLLLEQQQLLSNTPAGRGLDLRRGNPQRGSCLCPPHPRGG